MSAGGEKEPSPSGSQEKKIGFNSGGRNENGNGLMERGYFLFLIYKGKLYYLEGKSFKGAASNSKKWGSGVS